MGSTQNMEPLVGGWYRSHGQLFEVVATDDEERVIEIQHADGNLEEMDLEDWIARCRAGSLGSAEPPEDAGVAADHQHEDEYDPIVIQSNMDHVRGLRADSLEDLDLFE